MRSSFSRLPRCAAAAGALALSLLAAPGLAQDRAVAIPPPQLDLKATDGVATAVFAGGCFWGVQGVFQHTKGVVNAVSGYAGGAKASANYMMVSSGVTDHAETVEIKYDPKQVSYGRLLQIFFSVVHDPTELNRQGPDTGMQYRSAVFTTSDEQRKVTESYIAQLDAAGVFKRPIVTKVGPLQGFFAAEAYHQDYLTRHPDQPYIVHNDLPKIENLKQMFPADYREKPALVSSAKAGH